MDLAELKRRHDRSREHQVEIGARRFTLRLPSRAQAALVTETEGSLGQAVYALLRDAIVAWEGVMVGDVDPQNTEAASPLPCTPVAVGLFLDARVELLSELAGEFLNRCRERSDAMEAARKNSGSVSSGS